MRAQVGCRQKMAQRRESATAAVLPGADAAASEPKGLASGVMGIALAALGEFASPQADHGAVVSQTVLHRGDDLIGERDMRIDRRHMRIG
jgi:hypothetical protein